MTLEEFDKLGLKPGDKIVAWRYYDIFYDESDKKIEPELVTLTIEKSWADGNIVLIDHNPPNEHKTTCIDIGVSKLNPTYNDLKYGMIPIIVGYFLKRDDKLVDGYSGIYLASQYNMYMAKIKSAVNKLKMIFNLDDDTIKEDQDGFNIETGTDGCCSPTE